MRIFAAVFLLIFLVAAAGCERQPAAGEGIAGGQKQVPGKEPCICIAVYDPVCGSDGITYTNSCFAGCAGADWTKGACAG